jgi:hypothetical protein
MFRNSFKQHLLKLDPRLRAMDVSPSGSTEQTIRDYARAIRENRAEVVVSLLVDSETSVTADSPAAHLRAKLDSANVPQDARANLFLMVQCMEAWFVTDAQALKACYGARVHENALPLGRDIESVSKKDVLAALKAAVLTTPAGEYHKIRHGARILENLNPTMVAKRSSHARALHEFLCNSVRE